MNSFAYLVIMRKSLIFIILLFLSSCSPPASRIIPAGGLFTDPNTTYVMECSIKFGDDYQDYKFEFLNNEVRYLQIDDRKPYPVNVYDFGPTYLDFGIKGDKKSLFIFDKDDGSLSANAWSHGSCNDQYGGWTRVLESNTLIYTRPWVRNPGFTEVIKFRIKKFKEKLL